MQIEKKEIIGNIVRITTTDERWYLIDGEYYPSVNWITSYIPSKELMIWMAKNGYDRAEAIRQERADAGSKVHKAIEMLLNGNTISHNITLPNSEGEYSEITANEYSAVLTFVDWFNETKPEIIKAEHTIYNKQMKYAGTLDILCKINNENYIIDVKTSADIHLPHKAQISAYKHCLDIPNLKTAILQVGYKRNKKGWKFTDIDDYFDLFVAAYNFWLEDNRNEKPFQRDFPLEIKLEVNNDKNK